MDTLKLSEKYLVKMSFSYVDKRLKSWRKETVWSLMICPVFLACRLVCYSLTDYFMDYVRDGSLLALARWSVAQLIVEEPTFAGLARGYIYYPSVYTAYCLALLGLLWHSRVFKNGGWDWISTIGHGPYYYHDSALCGPVIAEVFKAAYLWLFPRDRPRRVSQYYF